MLMERSGSHGNSSITTLSPVQLKFDRISIILTSWILVHSKSASDTALIEIYTSRVTPAWVATPF